jgi:isocitrate/isopropylmalate dehydrogenase
LGAQGYRCHAYWPEIYWNQPVTDEPAYNPGGGTGTVVTTGQNVANPTALLLSAVLMLRHIGEDATASRVMSALGRVLLTGSARTRDLGGTTSTSEFADAVCRALN